MSLHKDLTGADLHEPKGIDSAASGDVYVADGAGSGVWGALAIPTGDFLKTFAFYNATATWSKPSNLIGVEVHLVGGGGGAGASTSLGGAGGNTTFATKAANGGAGGSSTVAGADGTGGSSGLAFAGGKDAFPFASLGTYGDGSAAGLGGGEGEYTISYIRASDLSSTESLTIGAGGTAGASGTAGKAGAAYFIHYIKAT